MEPGRYFPLIVVLALVAGLLYLGDVPLPFDTGDGPPTREKTEPSDQRISDFRLNESLSDTEVWSLESPEARRAEDRIDLTSPRVVYRIEGDTRVTVTADRGDYVLDTRTLTLRENVRLERLPENQILETDILHWNRPEGLIRTDAKVTLRMPRGVLRARGMRTRLREETVQFLSDVKFSSR